MASAQSGYRRIAGIYIDRTGFDKMLANIAPEKRKPIAKQAMLAGASVVKWSIRKAYKTAKPNSNLDKAIVTYVYPSGEGSVARRFYIKGGTAGRYPPRSHHYRSYILNFLEKGATDRETEGKIGSRWPMRRLNRGSIPALYFFKKGARRARKKTRIEVERFLLREIAKQARR